MKAFNRSCMNKECQSKTYFTKLRTLVLIGIGILFLCQIGIGSAGEASINFQNNGITNISNDYFEIILNQPMGNSIQSLYNKQTNSYIINITSSSSGYSDTNLFDYRIENTTDGTALKTQSSNIILISNSTSSITGGKVLSAYYSYKGVNVSINITAYDNYNYLKIDQIWYSDLINKRFQPWYAYMIRLFNDTDVGYSINDLYFIRPSRISRYQSSPMTYRFVGSGYNGIYENTKHNLLGFLILDEENISGIQEMYLDEERTTNREITMELGAGYPSGGENIYFGNTTNLPYHYYLYVGNETIDFVNFAENKINNIYGSPPKFNYDVSGIDTSSSIGLTSFSKLGFSNIIRWIYQLGTSGMQRHYNLLNINTTLLNEITNDTYSQVNSEGGYNGIYVFTEILNDSGEYLNRKGYYNNVTKTRKNGVRQQWSSTEPSLNMANDSNRNQILKYVKEFVDHSLEFNSSNIIITYDAIANSMYPDYGQYWNRSGNSFNRSSYIGSPSQANYSHDDSYVSNSRAIIYDFLSNVSNYVNSRNANYTIMYEGKGYSYELLSKGIAWNSFENDTYNFNSIYYPDIYTIRSDEASSVYNADYTNEDNIAWLRTGEGARNYEIWLSSYADLDKLNEIRRATFIGAHLGNIKKISYSSSVYIGNFNSSVWDEVVTANNYGNDINVTINCKDCLNTNYNVGIVGKGYYNQTIINGNTLKSGVEINVPNKSSRIILITKNSLITAQTSAWGIRINTSVNSINVQNPRRYTLPTFYTNNSNNDYYNFTNHLITSHASNNFIVNITSAIYTINLPFTFGKYQLTEGNSYTQALDNSNNVIDGIVPVWFSQTSLTEKHIASNLSDDVSVDVVISADCDNVGKITYTSDSGAFTRTYNHGDYVCTNNQITLSSLLIEPALNSNIITLSYNQAIQDICNDSGVTFSQSVALIGILLTIVLIGGVVSMIVLSFKGVIDLGNLSGKFNMEGILWGVLVVLITGLVLATVAFIVNGSVCPAYGA